MPKRRLTVKTSNLLAISVNAWLCLKPWKVTRGGLAISISDESWSFTPGSEVDGAEKSLIQYLPPDMLKAQLNEVSAEADN